MDRLWGDTFEWANEGPFETSDSNNACTQNIRKENAQVGNVKMVLIDTPGCNESPGKDRVHANNTCAFVYGSGGINNFIVVRNGANYRFDANFKLMLERYASMFGDEFWKHVIVVMTHVDDGLAERQFIQGNKATNMKNEVIRSFDLDEKECDIAVIPIGLDKYEEAIQEVIASLSEEKFRCDELKSPLQELKDRHLTMKQNEEVIQREVDKTNREIQVLQDKIDALGV